MEDSQGLNQLTQDNIIWGPSSGVDSPFAISSGVKNYIPRQKTPDSSQTTETTESFLSSSSLSSQDRNFPVPSTILYQDVPSPSPSSESELEQEESQTQLEPVVDIINNNNNNNKRKTVTAPSTSKKSSIKYTNNAFEGLHDQLDVCLAIANTEQDVKEQANLYKQVESLLKEEACPHCDEIKCTTKIPNAFALALGKKKSFFEDRIHKDSWQDMYNNRYKRSNFHQFWCIANGFESDTTPPPKCLKKLLTKLFPAPMHLDPSWKPVGKHHFLRNNPCRFMFNVEHLNSYFPLKDNDFVIDDVDEEMIKAAMME